MKLEKAIEIIERMKNYYSPERKGALNLGIEALRRLIAWRNDNDEDLLWDLPGETEE